MLYIKKRKEPDFLIRFKKKYPHKKYDSEEFREYRAPLNDILREEQKGLCAYCCCRIGKENSHNEHIQPQHQAMNANDASLDYSNLAASCNNKRTCGIKKKNHYDENKFVSPFDENCEDIFTYFPDGRMEGNQYTIDLLNLNDYELRTARKSVYRSLQHLDKQTISLIYLDETDAEYQPYANVIKWYCSTLA